MGESIHRSGPVERGQLTLRLLDLTARVLDRVVPYCLLLAAVAVVYVSVARLTSAQSPVAIWIALMGNRSVARGAGFVFGMAGVAYGLQERALRRAESRRLGARISALENQLASSTAIPSEPQ